MDGEFCEKCFNSFNAWAGNGAVVAPAAEPMAPPPAAKTDQKTDGIDALWSELMNTPAPPPSEWVDAGQKPKPVAPMPPVPHTPAIAVQNAASIAAPVLAPPVLAPPVPAPPVQLPSPPQAAPPVPSNETPKTMVSPPEVPVGEPIQIEPVTPPVAVPRAEPPAAKAAARNAPKPPAVVHSRPKARSKNLMALPSAIAVLGAVVYGGYWLQVHGYLSPESEREATVAAEQKSRDPQPAPRPAGRTNTAARSQPAAPRQARTQAAPPRPAGRQAPTGAAKARPASVPAPAPIPAASVAVPAVVTTLPAAPPRAAAASTAPSGAPQGPFFEPTDVHEAPRVASRVAPDLPEDLRGRARNEIVIVRMLISQIGRPSRVSLLRKSKAGPRVDDAVVAAVNQWTFAPARRKGEAVSSWFNIGVPVLAD